jgi:mono/diheme cytochrome c family protein
MVRFACSAGLLLVVLLCAALAGCGADDGDGTDVGTRGKELFSQRCGGCHTLSAAGTNGTRGVDLDYRKVSSDDALFAIRNGGFSGELMPANIVTGDDAEVVAEFVADVSGSKADGDLDSPDVRRMKAASAGAAAGQVSTPSAGISTTFLRAAFDSAQSLWEQKFADAGHRYEPADLIFFHTAIDTPCGRQTARTGPFYCPAALGVYLNTDFFDALGRTFGLTSPFAPGYITAHEIGLHSRVAAANAQDPTAPTSARSASSSKPTATPGSGCTTSHGPAGSQTRTSPTSCAPRRSSATTSSATRPAPSSHGDLDARLLRTAHALGRRRKEHRPTRELQHLRDRLISTGGTGDG